MTISSSQPPNDSLPNVLSSAVDTGSERFQSNVSAMRNLLAEFDAEQAVIRQGGGGKAIEAQHKKQRLTVRERLDLLLDPGAEFQELSIYAAHGMYVEYGGAPGGRYSHRRGTSRWPSRHDHRQRRYGQGWSVFP